MNKVNSWHSFIEMETILYSIYPELKSPNLIDIGIQNLDELINAYNY